MSERNFRRLCVRYEEEGVAGLRDRRIGKVSPHHAAERELERMHELFRERYSDFTVKHFHERLVRRHNYKLCHKVTRLSLQAAGLVTKAKRRGAQRKKRVRRPSRVGCCSRTARPIAGSRRLVTISIWWSHLDLVVTLDDAAGEVCSAFLVEQEGTASPVWCVLHRSRGHYFITPKQSCKVVKTQLTQVGRVLSPLAITHILFAAGTWTHGDACWGRC